MNCDMICGFELEITFWDLKFKIRDHLHIDCLGQNNIYCDLPPNLGRLGGIFILRFFNSSC